MRETNYFRIIFGDVFYPFGLSVVVDALRGRQWQESGAFPRVGLLVPIGE